MRTGAERTGIGGSCQLLGELVVDKGNSGSCLQAEPCAFPVSGQLLVPVKRTAGQSIGSRAKDMPDLCM